MTFDTFDEGIALGGIRNKDEIKTLICYLIHCVKESMSKNTVVESIVNDNIANFFETCAAFDDLIKNGNLIESGVLDGEQTYNLSERGIVIANQLETSLSYTVREKTYKCAIKLLAEKKKRRENKTKIYKTDNGYVFNCRMLGGDIDLFEFSLYAPDLEQANRMEKAFFDNPSAVYKTMLGLLTQDKETVGEALEDLYGVL